MMTHHTVEETMTERGSTLVTAQGKPHRFEVLDSWRGICACLIVFFHFNDEIVSHFQNISVVRNAYIFVDFFFVLSGFVICHSYQKKMLEGFPVKDYALLRFGRVYPLHLFMLAMFVLFECTKFFVDAKTPPFSTESSSVGSIIANIFLIQALGFFDYLSWNQLSWSISAEFYTYLLYALALVVCRDKVWIPALAAVLILPFVMIHWGGNDRMFYTNDYGFMRCVYGFSAGMLTFKIYPLAVKFLEKFSAGAITAVEVVLSIGIWVFASTFGDNLGSYWSPVYFGLCLLVFSIQKGGVSRLLLLKPFLILGMLSYSIYMVHTFVQLILYNVLKVAAKIADLDLFRPNGNHDYDIVSIGAWQGDALQIAGFVAVLIFSGMTYFFIEKPANEWVRKKVRGKSVQQTTV